MSLVPLLTLLAPAEASEGWLGKGLESVEIAAAVDVDLYTGADGRPFVIGTFGDGDIREAPVLIGLSGPNTVSGGLVADLGWRIRGQGAEATVKIPELRLGDVTLRDVRARVGDHTALHVGLIGLAVAVRPSRGVVTLAPASEGVALVQSVGSPQPATIEGDRAWWYHGEKRVGDGLSWQVAGEVAGAAGTFRVTAASVSSLGADVAVEPLRRGGEPYAWTTAHLAVADLGEVWLRQDQSLAGRDGTLLGALGADVLAAVDWAADPVTMQFAAAAVTPAPRDPTDALLAIARAAYARAEAEATPPDDPTLEDGAAVGRHTDLAEALWASGARGEALEHYRLAVASAGQRCGPFLTLGRRLLQDGQPDAALLPLQQAAAAWDRWDAQPLDVRRRVVEGRKVDDDVYTVEQAPGCHEAWGELAAARFAQGSYAEVRAIAAAQRELDPLPSQIAGLAALVEGDGPAANAALRQAVQIGARQDPWTLVALGWASARLDRPEAVAAQLHALAETPRFDLVAAWSAVRLAADAFGATAVVESATALTQSRPESAPAWLALAWARLEAGVDPAEATARAGHLAAAARARRPADDAAIAAWAVATALGGDVTAAQAALADAIAPSSADYWLAVALIATQAGDTEGGASILAALPRRFPTAPIPVGWAEPAVGDAP